MDLRERVRRRAVDRGEGAGLERRRAPLGVDIHHDGALASHRLQNGDGHQPKPAGADDQHRLLLDHRAELLERRIGRHARAGVGRDRHGIEPVERQQVFRVRDDDLVGIAAIAMNAEAARLHAQVFGPGAADAADAAADPGIDQHHLADLAVLDLRADGDDFPGCLVAERERQSDAAVGKAQALARRRDRSLLPRYAGPNGKRRQP